MAGTSASSLSLRFLLKDAAAATGLAAPQSLESMQSTHVPFSGLHRAGVVGQSAALTHSTLVPACSSQSSTPMEFWL